MRILGSIVLGMTILSQPAAAQTDLNVTKVVAWVAATQSALGVRAQPWVNNFPRGSIGREKAVASSIMIETTKLANAILSDSSGATSVADTYRAMALIDGARAQYCENMFPAYMREYDLQSAREVKKGASENAMMVINRMKAADKIDRQ